MSTAPRSSRRSFLGLAGGAALAMAACAAPPSPAPTPTAEPAVDSPDEALQRLLDGNRRYTSARPARPNQSQERRLTLAEGQRPFAVIVGCVDSRVPPEILFDRGLGDLLVIRTAGHALDAIAVGSVEFGVAELGASLVMVLGHEACGAVKATIAALDGGGQAEGLGSIGAVVTAIAPAVERSRGQGGDAVDLAVRENIAMAVERLRASPVLIKEIAAGTLRVVGARYDLDQGAVEMIVA